MEAYPEDFSPRRFASQLRERLHGGRTILLTEDITPATVERVTAQLADLAGGVPGAPVRLVVGAAGGAVEAGLALYDAVRFAAVPIRALATGRIGMAGLLAYAAAEKADRYALPNARFLLSRPAPEAVPGMNVEAAAAHAADLRARICQVVARQTGQPPDAVEADLRRGRFLGAQDAVAYGLASRVVTHAREMP